MFTLPQLYWEKKSKEVWYCYQTDFSGFLILEKAEDFQLLKTEKQW